MALSVIIGVIVVILAFAGQWFLALPLALVGAIVVNRIDRSGKGR